MKPTSTPHQAPTIRLTIPVTPEVHEAFTRISKASGMPVGRAMGEWLGDTIDAANYLAETLEKARAAPRLVAQQLHSYALGLSDETGSLLERLRKDPATRQTAERAGGRRPPGGAAGSSPPPCNTGGKVPQRKGKTA